MVLLTAPLDGRPAHLYARHFRGTVHARELVEALGYFHRCLRAQPIILIWDRLNVHRSRAVTRFLAQHATDFTVEWLPSYAPELNPEELCNQHVKRATLNALARDDEALRGLARRHFQYLGRHPNLLRSCFDHAGLRVT